MRSISTSPPQTRTVGSSSAAGNTPSSGTAGNERKALIVVTYHFPPDGAVGGFRWAGLAKYLTRNHGWQVHIVTAARSEGNCECPGVTIHSCPRVATLNDAYRRWSRRWRESVKHIQPAGERERPENSRSPIQWIRTSLSAAISFPDHGRGWILTAARRARSIVKRYPESIVITSGPPHSAHLAGVLACWGRDTRHCVDMRDPWAGMINETWGKGAFGPRVMQDAVRALERFVFRRSDHVVANTMEARAMLKEMHPQVPVSFVPNGIDLERLPATPIRKFEGVAVAYVGSLYAGRTLTTVLRGMRYLFDHFPESSRGLRLRVAGPMDPAHERQFRDDVEEEGLHDAVEAVGSLANAQAIDLLRRSHMALVLAQNQPTQVPAKLYEAIGLGLPTLVVTEPGSAAAREAGAVGALVCQSDDFRAIAGVFEQLWRGDDLSPNRPARPVDYRGIAVKFDDLLRNEIRHLDKP